MLLGGLLHGAGYNFIIWGGLHGLYLIINHSWRYFKNINDANDFVDEEDKSVKYIFFAPLGMYLDINHIFMDLIGKEINQYSFKLGKKVRTLFKSKEFEISRISDYTFSNDEQKFLLSTELSAI